MVEKHFDDFNFYKGINAVVGTIDLTNKFFDDTKPWILLKNIDDTANLNYVLHLTMESLRVSKDIKVFSINFYLANYTFLINILSIISKCVKLHVYLFLHLV